MSDTSVIVTSVFKTTVFLHKYLLFYYGVYLIFPAAYLYFCITKHSINWLQCHGNLSVPKLAAGRHLGFLKLKVSPLNLPFLKRPC